MTDSVCSGVFGQMLGSSPEGFTFSKEFVNLSDKTDSELLKSIATLYSLVFFYQYILRYLKGRMNQGWRQKDDRV